MQIQINSSGKTCTFKRLGGSLSSIFLSPSSLVTQDEDNLNMWSLLVDDVEEDHFRMVVFKYDQLSKLPKKVILENATAASVAALMKCHDVPSAHHGQMI